MASRSVSRAAMVVSGVGAPSTDQFMRVLHLSRPRAFEYTDWGEDLVGLESDSSSVSMSIRDAETERVGERNPSVFVGEDGGVETEGMVAFVVARRTRCRGTGT